MTARHGFFSTLRLFRRPPPSAPYTRSFGASRCLKDHALEEDNETGYDYRKPCYAARRDFPTHIRHLMRSTPSALTVIISCPSRQQYSDDPSAAALGNEDTNPASEVEKNDMDRLPEMAGLLVSSLNTVTLYPRPYVSFNIRLPSRTYATIKASNGFTASGLKDTRVAEAFTKRKPTRGDLFGEYVWRGLVESDGRLKKGNGGTWWMRCRLSRDKCVEVGDHMLVVAKVLECGGYEGGEGIGLVYAEGSYRKVGEVVDVEDVNGKDQGEERARFAADPIR